MEASTKRENYLDHYSKKQYTISQNYQMPFAYECRMRYRFSDQWNGNSYAIISVSFFRCMVVPDVAFPAIYGSVRMVKQARHNTQVITIMYLFFPFHCIQILYTRYMFLFRKFNKSIDRIFFFIRLKYFLFRSYQSIGLPFLFLAVHMNHVCVASTCNDRDLYSAY